MLKHGVQLAGPDGPGQRVDDCRRRLEARWNVRGLLMTSAPPTITDLQSHGIASARFRISLYSKDSRIRRMVFFTFAQ